MLVGPLGQLCLFFVVKRSKEHGRGKVSYDAQVNRFGAGDHGYMVGSRGIPKVKRDAVSGHEGAKVSHGNERRCVVRV